MSSDSLNRLTEKKGKKLSIFLGIESTNMQTRINNPH